jgi:hypothetical protein
MLALSTLYILTTELSMANDTLADDPQCPSLIQELILLFDKYFLPDITLYSLQCLNFLLDLNPAYTSTVKKFGGMPKIVLMTQNIEFIDLAEMAIKAIEKMSLENPYALLECDAFCSVLNLIDFFDFNLKKSALKSCINMTLSISSYDVYNKFIFPAIPSLTGLTKFNHNDTDHSVTSSAVLCFFYIFSNIKAYNLYKGEGKIEMNILQWGVIDNLYEIAIFYLKNDNSNIYGNIYGKNKSMPMSTSALPSDVFKNVLKIFQILCGISNEATNLLLNMNLLELVYSVLKREFGEKEENVVDVNNNNENENSSNSKSMIKENQLQLQLQVPEILSSQMIQNSYSFIHEIFPLLINLFPQKDTKDSLKENSLSNISQEKIMSKNNKTFYDFFAEKIIKLLISNIISISSCSTLIQVVKLLIIFCKFSSVEQISIYLDPQKISHIIGKLLDTKETFYLQEVLTLLELIMQKAPENFISSFLREGIVENMKDFKFDIEKYTEKGDKIENVIEKKDVESISQEKEKGKDDVVNHENHRMKTDKIEDEELSEEMEEFDEEDESEKSPYKENEEHQEVNVEEYIEEDDMIKDEVEFDNELKIAIELSRVINENIEKDKEMVVEKVIVNEKQNEKQNEKHDEKADDISNFKKSEIFEKVELKDNNDIKIVEINKANEPIIQPITTTNNNISSSSTFTHAKKAPKKTYTTSNYLDPKTNPEIKAIIALEEKLKIFIEKYLNDAKIKEYLEKVNEKENPLEIFHTLEKVKKEISDENQNGNSEKLKNSVHTLITILTNKDHKLTLWEIEKSQILLTLAQFLDSNFTKNYKNSKEDKDEKIQQDYNYNYFTKPTTKYTSTPLPLHDTNNPIVKKLKLLFSCLGHNIIELIKLIQYTITSMNCFIVYFNEGNMGLRDPSRYISNMYRHSHKDEKRFKLKLSYDCESANDLIKNIKTGKNIYHAEEDELLSQKIEKYNEYFLKKKIISMLVNQSETFIDIEKNLLNLKKEEDILTKLSNLLNIVPKSDEIVDGENNIKLSNRNPNSNSNDNSTGSRDVGLNFFMQFDLNGEKQIFPIEKTLSPNKVLDELKKNYTKEDLKNLLVDVPISFEIVIAKKSGSNSENAILNKIADTNNNNPDSNSNLNSNSLNSKVENIKSNKVNHDDTYELFKDLDYNSDTDIDIDSNTAYNLFEQRLFEKYYTQLIVCNPNLYEIKRLAPSLYLLAVLNLCMTKFSSLFNLNLNTTNISIDTAIDSSSSLLIQEFENSKVSNLLLKQVRDMSSISLGSIPSWCRNLTLSFPFLSNFNSRYLFFKTCAFDPKRGMINLHTYLKNFSGSAENTNSQIVNLSKNKRYKIIVERNEILAYAMKIQKEMSSFNGYLEFEYTNETGTGLGPTLEFYSLCIEKLREKKSLWYKTTDKSLFPAPINDGYSNYEENKKMFNLLGFLIARALYDDRLVDIPLSSLFWDLVLNRPINFRAISQIDSDLGNTIVKDFLKIIKEKNKFLKKNPNFNDDLGEEIKYNNMRIDEIGILFNLPGYPEIELKEDGLEHLLTIYNIEEYVIAVFDKLFGQGIKPLIESFKQGFNLVFDIESLKAFDSREIEETLLGSKEEKWSYDHLYESIKPDHGYDKTSNSFRNLIKFMCELENKEKKKFLLFVTGSPRLPLGGKKNF